MGFKKFTSLLVFVLVIGGIGWSQTQIGSNLVGCSNCKVANSVTISDDGTRFVIGNPGVGGGTGAIEAFNAIGSSISFTGAIFAPGGQTNFGYVVALAGNSSVLTVSATENSKGVVNIYTANGNAWDIATTLPSATTGANFGESVSINADGTRMAIGDSQETQDPAVANQFGAVHVYENQSGNWVQIGSTLYPDPGSPMGSFGKSVAISADGQRLVVGEYLGANGDGKVTVYEWANNDWQPVGSSVTGPAGQADNTGYSVDLNSDGSRIVVGAPQTAGTGTNVGTIRSYEWQGGSWQQIGPVLSGDGDNDFYGSSVSMSDNGNRIAIGAPSTNAGIGYTRIVDWTGFNWVDTTTIAGLTDGDLAGFSVALSGNTTRVMIGAPGNNPINVGGGLGRLFEFTPVSSIKEEFGTQTLEVAPNPTTGYLRIGAFTADQLSVYDAYGQLVFQARNINEIDLSAFPAGIYALVAIHQGDWFTTKVVKQ
jgi:hypothetical protein